MEQEKNEHCHGEECHHENHHAEGSASHAKTGGNKNINATTALIIIVAVLVVMAGIQVFQTQKLLAAVSSGTIKSASAAPAQGGSSGLQSQVGGCG